MCLESTCLCLVVCDEQNDNLYTLQSVSPCLLPHDSGFRDWRKTLLEPKSAELFGHAHVRTHPPSYCVWLQGLEERFLGLIEPKLAAAMSQKNGERVQQLSAMLMGIQCYDTVEKLYITARMAPLQVCYTLILAVVFARKYDVSASQCPCSEASL